MQHLLFIDWDPNPNTPIGFGHFYIKWYGLLWGLSLLLCYFIGLQIFKRLKRDDDKLTIALQYVFLGGLIGARLAHILFYDLDFYLANPAKIVAVWEGGLASHGGLVGGVIGLYLFCRHNKEYSFLWWLDISAICFPVLAALVRIGNLINSELYGIRTTVPWAFIFREVDNTPRHPVVLYESMAYLALAGIMWWMFTKYKESKPGIYISVFLVYIFSVRFLLEFLKQAEGWFITGVISKTQALSIPFIIIGLIMGYYVMKGKLHYGKMENT